jgi:hypothetical protein
LNATTGNVNKEQHEHIDPTAKSPNLRREEVARPKRCDMSLKELSPTAFASLRARVETAFAQDIANRGTRDRANPKLL